jgi:hypothetical protein
VGPSLPEDEIDHDGKEEEQQARRAAKDRDHLEDDAEREGEIELTRAHAVKSRPRALRLTSTW